MKKNNDESRRLTVQRVLFSRTKSRRMMKMVVESGGHENGENGETVSLYSMSSFV